MLLHGCFDLRKYENMPSKNESKPIVTIKIVTIKMCLDLPNFNIIENDTDC